MDLVQALCVCFQFAHCLGSLVGVLGGRLKTLALSRTICGLMEYLIITIGYKKSGKSDDVPKSGDPTNIFAETNGFCFIATNPKQNVGEKNWVTKQQLLKAPPEALPWPS